jgi:ribosomal protein S18 acetylase RimI-like enzyme
MLYDKAITEAREQARAFVWLGVWENNHLAIAFYRSRGFVEVGTHSFQMGDVVDRDLIMRRDL